MCSTHLDSLVGRCWTRMFFGWIICVCVCGARITCDLSSAYTYVYAQARVGWDHLYLISFRYCLLCVCVWVWDTHWINFAFLFLASSSPFGRDRIEWRPGPQHSLSSSFLEPILWRDPATHAESGKCCWPNVINVSAEMSNITKRPKFLMCRRMSFVDEWGSRKSISATPTKIY
jgi:hypothetical protein